MVTEGHVPIQAIERVGPDAVDPSGRPVSPPNLPVDYLERFYALTLKPDFADTVFAHIANGGTLITLAATWGVRHSDISAFIGKTPALMQQYTTALIARGEWEQERLLQELRAIATVDIRQAYNADGTLKAVRDMPPELAAALSSVETDELFEGTGAECTHIGYTKRVKFWDKAKAIELFMKKHGLLVDRVKVTHTMRLEDLVGASHDEPIEAEVVPEQKLSVGSAEPGGGTGVLESPPNSA